MRSFRDLHQSSDNEAFQTSKYGDENAKSGLIMWEAIRDVE